MGLKQNIEVFKDSGLIAPGPPPPRQSRLLHPSMVLAENTPQARLSDAPQKIEGKFHHDHVKSGNTLFLFYKQRSVFQPLEKFEIFEVVA